jgi:hypothetical protein
MDEFLDRLTPALSEIDSMSRRRNPKQNEGVRFYGKGHLGTSFSQ